MKANFNIDSLYDICLLPFSPLCESDVLEIRVQGYNDRGTGAVDVRFEIDGRIIEEKSITVQKETYGYTRCRVALKGLKGKHVASVNGNEFEFEVFEKKLAVLDGGFAMIGPPNDRVPVDSFREVLKSFTDQDWENYIERLKDIGCNCIIFHNCQEYSLYNNFNPDPKNLTAHYDSKFHQKSDIKAKDPIGAVLEVAEKHDIKVFLSVGNCYGHTGSDDDFYELYKLYGKYTSFYGWYLSNELDMKNFYREGWEVLKHQTEIIRKISPVKPVLVSPFDYPSNETVEYIKRHDVFDIMMPQDCVGQERLTLQESESMHRNLREVCNTLDKHLWANCEAFNFKDGILVPRYKNGGMDGESGFVQQIATVTPYVEKIMNFAYTGFFTPEGFTPVAGGPLSVKQFKEYLQYYLKVKGEVNYVN